jgi:hypothetical protein
MAEIPEKPIVSIEVTQRKVEKQLASIAKKMGDTAKQGEEAFVKSNTKAAASVKNVSFATSNMAAQLNDIGVSLASGQSPFTVMIQQGTQVSQLINQTGGSLKTFGGILAGAFTQMLNPVSLATFAVIGLGGAAIKYALDSSDKIGQLDEAIKAHDQLIRELKSAYGEAAEGLDNYVKRSDEELAATARRQVETFRAAARDSASAFIHEIAAIYRRGSGQQGTLQVDERFTPFTDAIRRLRTEAQAGEPDMARFRQAVEAIVATDPENLRKLGDELLASGEAASRAQERMLQAEAAINLIGDAASGQISAVNALAKAMNDLAGIALPKVDLSSRTQAALAYKAVLNNPAAGKEDTAVAQRDYQAALDRIANKEAGVGIPVPGTRPNPESNAPPKKAGGGGGGKKSAGEKFDTSTESIRARIEALKAETAALSQINPLENDYGYAVAKVRTEQQLLADAQRAGLKITPELRDTISQLAEEYASASVEAQKLAESQRAATQTAQEMKALEKDVLKGFISDLRAGKSGAEALAGALQKVADKLFDIALDSVFKGGGGGFGFIGKLFGFADGGIAAHGRPVRTFASGGVARSASIFGEAGPEAAVPLPDGRRIPVDLRMPSMAAGGREVIDVVLRDDSGRMAAIADQQIQTRSGAIVRVSVAESTKAVHQSLPQMMGDIQTRKL